MDAETGQFHSLTELSEMFGPELLDDEKELFETPDKRFEKTSKDFLAKIRKIETKAKEAGMVMWEVGEEVEIKGCRFKVVYLQSGKNRITLEGIPKDKL